MSDNRLVDALNGQIGYEFSASQQYIAIAVYYESETLPRLAGFFYRQAVEERNHAMMIAKYLLDIEATVKIPGSEAPQTDFADIVAPVALSLGLEKGVSDMFDAHANLAREEGDHKGEQFLQWFIKEQVEEVSTMSDLLKIVERSRENPLLAEEYLARESIGGEADPTAPGAAGGAL